MNLRSLTQRMWDPWHELGRIQQELNRVFNARPTPMSANAPLVNIWRGEAGVLVTLELPGIDPEKLDITVHDDTVTIRGERPAQPLQEHARFHRNERPTGQFSRTLQLPFRLDANGTEAKYEKGILAITLKQVREERPQKIAIKAS
jgi:HSP20 family protein